jgi:hypothetical protein
VEVGEALLEIRDHRLYKQQGYGTFEEYCRERWGWSKTHANRQIEAASVVANLTPIGVIPRTESQARELTRLTPEQQRSVAGRVDFSVATALEIREEVRRESRRCSAGIQVVCHLAIQSRLYEKEIRIGPAAGGRKSRSGGSGAGL